MRRIQGFLLIIRALTPLLMAVTVVWAASQMVSSLRAAVDEPLTGLKTEVDALGPTLSTAWQKFDDAAGSALGGLAGLASRLGSFTLPNIQAEQLGIFLGGLAKPLNGLLRGVEQVFHPLGKTLSGLSALGRSVQVIPDRLKRVVDQGEVIIQQVRAVIERWSGLIAIAVLVILGLVALYGLLPFIEDFRRGWRMLTSRGENP